MSLKPRVPTLALIGVGVMGEAILTSLVAAVGRSNVRISDGRLEHSKKVAERHRVDWHQSNADAVTGADVVVLAVKPQDLEAVAQQISPQLTSSTLIVSVAAGVSTAKIAGLVNKSVPIVRVMPNTPATIGHGVAVLSTGEHAGSKELDLVAELFSNTGRVEVVPEELQDTVTAISGSGPAYVFYLIEAMATAGEKGGLLPDVALRLATQTVAGAAAMAAGSSYEPGELRRQVTSPGGTTAAAIGEFDARGVADGIVSGAQKAWERSKELGE